MSLPPDPVNFIVTLALSFLTGLEIKTYRQKYHPEATNYFFGTARTTTFWGILGFIFYKIDHHFLIVYTAGLLVFAGLFALFYRHRLQEQKTSILLFLVSMAVYSYGPLTTLYPLWMPALLFVLIVFILNAKTAISAISSKFNTHELETLGKMVLLSAVILPLLPNNNVIPYIPLSPFKIWLAVVVVSTISYGGYLAQQYLFPGKGIFLTGLIGGSYSSTATTVVLAKKAKGSASGGMITAAIIAATAVMYLRLIVVAFVFNQAIAKTITLPFTLLAALGFGIALFYGRPHQQQDKAVSLASDNPLELRAAFIFAALFVIMILLTQTVTRHYGVGGLKLFSFIAGLTDIDPFILSLLTGKYAVSPQEIYAAIVISAGSNNILKAIYALWFGGWKRTNQAAVWLLALGLITILIGLWGNF